MTTCTTKSILRNKITGQCAWVKRTRVLGLKNGFAVVPFSVNGETPRQEAVIGKTFTEDWEVDTPKTGTVSMPLNSNTITGTNTLFTTEFAVNDDIAINCCQYKIVSIESNTSMTVTPEADESVENQEIHRLTN